MLDERRSPAHGYAVCFFRSSGQALAAAAADSARFRRAGFYRDRAFCADPFYCAANAGAVFVTAIKGPAQIVGETKSSGPIASPGGAVGKIRGDTAGRKETGRSSSATGTGASAQKIAD